MVSSDWQQPSRVTSRGLAACTSSALILLTGDAGEGTWDIFHAKYVLWHRFMFPPHIYNNTFICREFPPFRHCKIRLRVLQANICNIVRWQMFYTSTITRTGQNITDPSIPQSRTDMSDRTVVDAQTADKWPHQGEILPVVQTVKNN